MRLFQVVHGTELESFQRQRGKKTSTVKYIFTSIPRLNVSGVPERLDESAFPGHYVQLPSTQTEGGASEFSFGFWWPARKANILWVSLCVKMC